jgi:hypothetical protein
VLLIDIHQLDVVLANSIRLRIFELQVDHIRCIFRLESEDVFVLSGAQDFGEGGEVDAEGDVAVAAEGGEGFGLEHHGDESNVRVVHRLEGDAGVIAVEVAVLHQVFDSIHHLLEQLCLFQPCLQHDCGSV